MKQTLFILSVLTCVCSACTETKSETYEDLVFRKLDVNGYVYIEQNGTLHATHECIDLDMEEGVKGVKRIPTKDINDSLLTYTCPDCVNDRVYNVLDSIAKSK